MTTPTAERQVQLKEEAIKQLFENGSPFSEKHGMNVTDDELVWMRNNFKIELIRSSR